MLRISHKIALSFGALILVMLGILYFGYHQAVSIRNLALQSTITEREYNQYVDGLKVDFTSFFSTVEATLSILDLEALGKRQEELDQTYVRIQETLGEYLTKEDEFFKFSAAILKQDAQELFEKNEYLFRLLNAFAQMRASEYHKEEIAPLRREVMAFLDEIGQVAVDKHIEIQNDIDKKLNRAQLLAEILAGSVLIFGIFVGFLLWKGTISPIGRLTRFLKNNTDAKDTAHVPFVTRKDEIGDFSRAFQGLLFARNIAEESLKEQAEDLQKSKNDAERANLAKSEFLANMSHELRTPLNSIMGMAQLIDHNALDEETLEMIEAMTRSSENLLQIVNDILDLSKIEAGEVHLEYIAFDVCQKIRHTVQSLKPLASKKGLTLSYDIATESDIYTLGDPLRFSRVLINLINNAIRYTESGTVDVHIGFSETSLDQIRLRCEITDTGIGIPEDRLEKIFDKFTQADTSTTRQFGGTGLGLTITKELLELMDGEIGVESEVGKGSTFWFEIPFETTKELYREEKNAERPLPESENAIPAEMAKVLMAEDQPTNVLFMKKLFKNIGIQRYTIVENGLEALKEVIKQPYDLVLMDCHMPEMNGYDATISIRNLQDERAKNVPIIAMTANVMPKDEQKCLDMGMDAYISKPVDIQKFVETLSPWIKFTAQKSGKNAAEVKVDSTQDDSDFLVSIGTAETDNAPQAGDDAPINLDNLRSNSMGDDEFMREMVGMFISQSEEKIESLKSLTEDGSTYDWTEISHALKGAAGTVGAAKMREYCERSQKLTVNDAATRKEILEKIKSEYQKAKDALIKENLYEA